MITTHCTLQNCTLHFFFFQNSHCTLHTANCTLHTGNCTHFSLFRYILAVTQCTGQRFAHCTAHTIMGKTFMLEGENIVAGGLTQACLTWFRNRIEYQRPKTYLGPSQHTVKNLQCDDFITIQNFCKKKQLCIKNMMLWYQQGLNKRHVVTIILIFPVVTIILIFPLLISIVAIGTLLKKNCLLKLIL